MPDPAMNNTIILEGIVNMIPLYTQCLSNQYTSRMINYGILFFDEVFRLIY